MIDTVIVGRYLGESGLAAMSLVSPVYLIYYTVGAVIGMGGSIAANLYIGKNDYDAYRRIFTLSFWMTIAVCVFITAAALVFWGFFVSMPGGSGTVREYAADYLFYYSIGGSGTLLIYIPLNFLKSDGKPRASSMLFLLSSGLNVALIWLFMSPVCGMGIKGAAIATGISMSLTAAIGFLILFRKTPNTYLVKTRPEAGLMRKINTIQRPLLSNAVLFLRLLAFLVPAVFLLRRIWGVDGVWMSLAAAEIMTLAAIWLVVRGIQKRSPGLDRYLLDMEGRGEEISFSVCNTVEDIMFASNKITDFCESAGLSAKKTMQVSLALEEMLTVIVEHCMGEKKGQFIDIRIVKTGGEVLLRIRNAGKIFDPVRFYEENKDKKELAERVLGIKMIVGTAGHFAGAWKIFTGMAIRTGNTSTKNFFWERSPRGI